MPISSDEFYEKGTKPKQRRVQSAIVKVLRANDKLAFSSAELSELVGTRRESVNQALRALEARGKIIRGYVRRNKRDVVFAKIKSEEEKEKEESNGKSDRKA